MIALAPNSAFDYPCPKLCKYGNFLIVIDCGWLDIWMRQLVDNLKFSDIVKSWDKELVLCILYGYEITQNNKIYQSKTALTTKMNEKFL